MGDIQQWGSKIKWGKRVKAICKPCWELKYCPYGPLVEEFDSTNTDQTCRIFGHDCPVFYLAEPLTETKELRNISRKIPRVTQFRVLKRDHQICQNCGNFVLDKDIEFDHIIPYSKGGSSDENNVRLLCSTCNRKRSNDFEDELLVRTFWDHTMEKISFEVVEFLLETLNYYHSYIMKYGKSPQVEDFAETIGDGDYDFGERAHQIVSEIISILNEEMDTPVNKKHLPALKFRWGFMDGKMYTVTTAL